MAAAECEAGTARWSPLGAEVPALAPLPLAASRSLQTSGAVPGDIESPQSAAPAGGTGVNTGLLESGWNGLDRRACM